MHCARTLTHARQFATLRAHYTQFILNLTCFKHISLSLSALQNALDNIYVCLADHTSIPSSLVITPLHSSFFKMIFLAFTFMLTLWHLLPPGPPSPPPYLPPFAPHPLLRHTCTHTCSLSLSLFLFLAKKTNAKSLSQPTFLKGGHSSSSPFDWSPMWSGMPKMGEVATRYSSDRLVPDASQNLTVPSSWLKKQAQILNYTVVKDPAGPVFDKEISVPISGHLHQTAKIILIQADILVTCEEINLWQAMPCWGRGRERTYFCFLL